MFKILPDAKIKWNVWLGSIVTGILFTIGKTLLAFYFSIANPASVYGLQAPSFSPVVVSYSSMILFFGAEFTAAYAKSILVQFLPPQSQRNRQTVKKI
jgi:membrane protein